MRADTPVVSGGHLDWLELPDQVIRNLACWLFAVRELLVGQSFTAVNERWPCWSPATDMSKVVKKEEN